MNIPYVVLEDAWSRVDRQARPVCVGDLERRIIFRALPVESENQGKGRAGDILTGGAE